MEGRSKVKRNPRPQPLKGGLRTLIEQARRDRRTGRNRTVWLFGEMVDLLWPTNTAAAERLEELSNEVIQEYSIPILCAYSVGRPGRGPLSESLIRSHSHALA